MDTRSPTLVLVNTASGSSDPEEVDEVCRALEVRSRSGTEVRDAQTDEEHRAAVALARGRDVVVVGGDGTVHRFLQELLDQQLLREVLAVGIVPMGTGNDLARDAGLPMDWPDAVDVALEGRPTGRGLLVDDQSGVVTNVVHCGVAAEATAHAADVKGLLGRAAYVWGAVRAGLTSRGWHLRVVVDDQVVEDGSRRLLMVSAALGSTVGGGTRIAPDTDAGDGQVHVVIAHGTSVAARVGFARDLRKGRHTERADVTVTRGRVVQVEAAAPRDAFPVNADGDLVAERLRGRRWELLADAWRLRMQP